MPQLASPCSQTSSPSLAGMRRYTHEPVAPFVKSCPLVDTTAPSAVVSILLAASARSAAVSAAGRSSAATAVLTVPLPCRSYHQKVRWATAWSQRDSLVAACSGCWRPAGRSAHWQDAWAAGQWGGTRWSCEPGRTGDTHKDGESHGASWNGVTPKSWSLMGCSWMFHYKPSILGDPSRKVACREGVFNCWMTICARDGTGSGDLAFTTLLHDILPYSAVIGLKNSDNNNNKKKKKNKKNNYSYVHHYSCYYCYCYYYNNNSKKNSKSNSSSNRNRNRNRNRNSNSSRIIVVIVKVIAIVKVKE